MSGSCSLSIVIFADKQESLEKTIESIQRQPDAKDIQLLVVPVEQAALSTEYQKQPGASENILLIAPDEAGDIKGALKGACRGRYLTFTKAGIIYKEQLLVQLLSHAAADADVIVAPIAIQEKYTKILREHNAYCRRSDRHTTLETNAYLLHNMYMGYFVKADSLCWQEEITLSEWYFAVLKMLFQTAVSRKRISCVKQELLETENGQQLASEWDAYFKNIEACEEAYYKLLLPFRQIMESDGVIYRGNAEYVLLYYCMRLLNAVGHFPDVPETFVQESMQFADGIFSKLTNAGFVIANQYLSKLQKKYLLEKYYDAASLPETKELAVILKPEYARVRVYFWKIEDKTVYTEFAVLYPAKEQPAIYCYDGNTDVSCERFGETEEIKWGSVTVGTSCMYRAKVPMQKASFDFAWKLAINGTKRQMKEIVFMRYMPLAREVFLYHRYEDFLIYAAEEHTKIRIVPYRAGKLPWLSLRRTLSFVRQGVPGIKAVAARMLYKRQKRRQTKQVWLVSDRTNRGDDNGEVMFRYLCANAAEDIEPYFVVDKGTPDWNEMKKLGRVVEPFSKQHKLLFLLSEFSLSSQANRAVINPFGSLEYFYRDLMYDKRLVFLQHGITKDNQSKWLNKYNRNLFGFIVTTQPEYDSVFEYAYYYDKEHVWLTGMPRYDRLYHDEKKYVTIMPTWRKSLSAGTDSAGVWILGDAFVQSDYFKFYNELLNDKRLLAAAEEYGYTVCFMPHPNTISGIGLFGHDKRVKFMDASYSYRDVFAQTDLMVTDYSSVAFDFAYLRKPIVYAQFDKEEFFNGEHSYTEGYFDYERDGFGEVEYDLAHTVDRIIEYMASDCALKEQYRKRVDETFAFRDKDCSKRVYETILKYRQKK